MRFFQTRLEVALNLMERLNEKFSKSLSWVNESVVILLVNLQLQN